MQDEKLSGDAARPEIEAAAYIRGRIGNFVPKVALILGSGLGHLADEIEDAAVIGYKDVPHFPVSTVAGHAGLFVIGRLEGKPVIAMQGRVHYYEGYPFGSVVFPVYVMRQLGARSLIVTNAAGGMNPSFRPGDLMLIRDHIQLFGDNPLIGPNDAGRGARFPDMSQAYDREYGELLRGLAAKLAADREDGLRLVEGVYCGYSGPSYCTPAELKMLAMLGGDAIGMSTAGEAIAARHSGMRVLGVSCITDMAVADSLEPLTHEQVMATAERTKPKFSALIREFLQEMPG